MIQTITKHRQKTIWFHILSLILFIPKDHPVLIPRLLFITCFYSHNIQVSRVRIYQSSFLSLVPLIGPSSCGVHAAVA